MAALEADVEAEAILHLFPNPHHAFAAGHVHRHGFLAVNVLSGVNDGLQMPGMENVGRGDLHHVDVRTVCQGLISPRPAKHQLGIDARIAMLGGNGVKVLLALVQLVLKEVGQSHHARGGVVGKRCGDVRAAMPAAEQSQSNRRVRRRAAHKLRLDDHDPRSAGGAEELPPAHLLLQVLSSFFLLCLRNGLYHSPTFPASSGICYPRLRRGFCGPIGW